MKDNTQEESVIVGTVVLKNPKTKAFLMQELEKHEDFLSETLKSGMDASDIAEMSEEDVEYNKTSILMTNMMESFLSTIVSEQETQEGNAG